MDDDDLRRGLPTCHVKFGEANAILAGDALQTLAFSILSDANMPEVSDRDRISMISAQDANTATSRRRGLGYDSVIIAHDVPVAL